MCNEEVLQGCFDENASFCMAVKGGREPVPRCIDSCISKKKYWGVFLFLFPTNRFELKFQIKNGPIQSSLFEKLILPLNFNCFEAHSFPMAVLVRTVGCATVS